MRRALPLSDEKLAVSAPREATVRGEKTKNAPRENDSPILSRNAKKASISPVVVQEI